MSAVPTGEWRGVHPMSYEDAILAVMSRDPAMGALLAHQHECMERTKDKMDRLAADLPKIIESKIEEMHKAHRTSALGRMDAFIRVATLVVAIVAAFSASVR